jgi:hypothetical protein
LLWNNNPAGAAAPVVDGWLEVTLRANDHTGLARDDVFYFGNLVGETGDAASPSTLAVSALDLSAVRRALNASSPITGPTDFNRDGRTNALDLSAVRAHLNRTLPLAAVPIPAAAPAQAVWLAPPAPERDVRRVADDVLG